MRVPNTISEFVTPRTANDIAVDIYTHTALLSSLALDTAVPALLLRVHVRMRIVRPCGQQARWPGVFQFMPPLPLLVRLTPLLLERCPVSPVALRDLVRQVRGRHDQHWLRHRRLSLQCTLQTATPNFRTNLAWMRLRETGLVKLPSLGENTN